MNIRLFEFDLPAELIATYPAKEREDARLLVSLSSSECRDSTILKLLDCITARDLIIFNETRVLKARLTGQRASGGKIFCLITRLVASDEAHALLQSSHSLKIGERLKLFAHRSLTHDLEAEILQKLNDGEMHLKIIGLSSSLETWLEQGGMMPIPPYFKRPAEPIDEQRYQTIFGTSSGSVAASTAGLHFGQPLMALLNKAQIPRAFITLHIGLGTFQPVRVEQIQEHRMHAERYHVPEETLQAIQACHARGGRVIAVGTTVLRALESSLLYGTSGETRLFIRPGFQFKVVDLLLTNFHLPRSSLLILIAAFAGLERFRRLYAHALEEKYRFLSYGDAMLLARAPEDLLPDGICA